MKIVVFIIRSSNLEQKKRFQKSKMEFEKKVKTLCKKFLKLRGPTLKTV